MKQLFCIMVTPESLALPFSICFSNISFFFFFFLNHDQFNFILVYFYFSIVENQRLLTLTCGTSYLGKAAHSPWLWPANICPLLWVGFEEMWGSEILCETAFPSVQSRREREKGAMLISPCVLLPLSPGAASCLWSLEYHRSKRRSLGVWTHQARSQGQFLAQPSLVSSSGSGWTVWYLFFFLQLLQFP